jgi:hypothetical protein
VAGRGASLVGTSTGADAALRACSYGRARHACHAKRATGHVSASTAFHVRYTHPLRVDATDSLKLSRIRFIESYFEAISFTGARVV